ncbi:MAG: succinate dehydrogenase cytochrome b subunit [Ferruginibacter sp.]
MAWKQFLTSSIGKKFVMAFTGLFLITFLIVHVGINSCIFLNDGGVTFNTVGHFMSHNWIVRFLEVGLFAGLILHTIQGLLLWKQNRSARPIAYHKNKPEKNSTWYSRSMGLLGSLLLIFLVIHLIHFWIGARVALYNGDEPHDLFVEMKEVFSLWWVVLIYIVGVIALFWHLLHGFQSAFQTFGLNHKKYTPIIKALGAGYSIIITILFILMPLAIYFQWIV